MGQRAAAGTGSQGRALARAVWFCLGRPLALVLLLAGLAVSQPCRADDPVRGEATFTSGGGFARLVLKLAEDVESDVSTAGSIIIIHFKRPVDIPVDKLSDAVPDYVGSARRDPDGTAIRLSRARVTALGYFDSVEINTRRGSSDDKMILDVTVKDIRDLGAIDQEVRTSPLVDKSPSTNYEPNVIDKIILLARVAGIAGIWLGMLGRRRGGAS